MKYCFDIDGTICTLTDGDYTKAMPFKERIDYINKIINDGGQVVFYTARGGTSGVDWQTFTVSQLQKWGILNPQIIFNKPAADLYVDDKARESDFFWESVLDSQI